MLYNITMAKQTICGSDKNSCTLTGTDASIKTFTATLVFFMYLYILSNSLVRCASLDNTKKFVVNMIITTLGLFTAVTVWYSGVTPNEFYDALIETNGEFYQCTPGASDKEGYIQNGIPHLTKGGYYYLSGNLTPTSSGTHPLVFDSNAGEPLTEGERHFYHLIFSFGVGAFIALIVVFRAGS